MSNINYIHYMPNKRKLSESVKNQVAGKQRYKCANKPGSNLAGIGDYQCPLYKDVDNTGCFDESGYIIYNIMNHYTTRDDDISNLCAICRYCHTIKTRNFIRQQKLQKQKIREQKLQKQKLQEEKLQKQRREILVSNYIRYWGCSM